jgi:hypothetical protein
MKVICIQCRKPGVHWMPQHDWWYCDLSMEDDLRQMIWGSD